MADNIPELASARIVTAMKKFGWSVAREGGKHTIMVHPDCDYPVSIPRHNPVKKGTLRHILKAAGIEVAEFNRKR